MYGILSPFKPTKFRSDIAPVTELMKPKTAKKTTEVPSNKPKGKLIYAGRDGLGAYTEHPDHFPKDVIYQDEKYVAIHDRFPKSSVHTLLLPRGDVNMLHPLEAFQDLHFLKRTEEKAQKLKNIVAKELQRKFGQFSAQDKAREAVLDGDVDLADGEELPKGRDWESEVLVGVHLHPSMNHLHIHVLSRDNYSGCLKHRNHYNSFNTPFFVRLDEFPLGKDDPRLLQNWERCENYLERDMRCWRCGKNFGRSMVRLKEHLKEEFEGWKKE